MSLQHDESVTALSQSGVKAEVSSLKELTRAVWSRRSEYSVTKNLRVKVGTWNVAALQGSEKDVGAWFVKGKGRDHAAKVLVAESPSNSDEQGSNSKVAEPQAEADELDDIGLYVLGLQEIVDVSSATEALRPYQDKAPGERWKSSVLATLPRGYALVAEQQLIGMYVIMYASHDVFKSITNISCKAVGTGLMGYMGNKGAVSIRIVLGETTKMVFINSHLAAGAQPQSLDRRNWDAEQIINRLRFTPIDHGHGLVDEVEDTIGDEDFAFWFGDLNYRLADLPGDDIRRLLTLHSHGEYSRKGKIDSSSGEVDGNKDGQLADPMDDTDISDPEPDPDQDPESVETTIASLLPHDELLNQMNKGKSFHQGWKEGKIRFLPTYKYDVGSVASFDSSEKRRAPSWCDRILFRSKEDYISQSSDASRVARQTTTELETKPNDEANGESDYNPDTDEYDPEQDGLESDQRAAASEDSDPIAIEYYTSHQNILSSDHKPLDAVFSVRYTSIDPNRKAEIYQQVAKEFDRMENESRPNLSVVVDTPEGKSSQELIDFGVVRFNQKSSVVLTVANTGQVDTLFGFVPRDLSKAPRPWLEVECDCPISDQSIQDVDSSYLIAPGEACSITITFWANNPSVARKLASSLEDVLILRVAGGRDHFLTLRANWTKTTLGYSVDELIRLPEGGVREVAADNSIKCSAPRELFRLTEALESNLERAVAEWGMKGDEGRSPPWNQPHWPFRVDNVDSEENLRLVGHIQESLDAAKSFDLQGVDSVHKTEVFAQALTFFLNSLDDGIVPENLWDLIRDEAVEYEKIKKPTRDDQSALRVKISEIMSTSTPHNISFQLLVTMIRRMVGELSLSHLPGAELDKIEQERKKEQFRKDFVSLFQSLLFRPLNGWTSNLGKEANRNTSRRSMVLSLFVDEAE